MDPTAGLKVLVFRESTPVRPAYSKVIVPTTLTRLRALGTNTNVSQAEVRCVKATHMRVACAL